MVAAGKILPKVPSPGAWRLGRVPRASLMISMPWFPIPASNWEEQCHCSVTSAPTPSARKETELPLPAPIKPTCSPLVSGICKVLCSVGPHSEHCPYQCMCGWREQVGVRETITLTQSSLTGGPAPTRNVPSFLSHEKRIQRLPFSGRW